MVLIRGKCPGGEMSRGMSDTCILIFIFNFIAVFIRVLFFYRCLDLIVYIVTFIIVLYLSIQLQS